MTIGGLGTYGSIYDVRVNQSTKAKNTASSDFSKTMETASEISSVRSRESVRESVVTRHTEYMDPETNEKVPVDIRYTTSYSEEGIVCRERSDVGGNSSERELWSLSFESPGDNKKVQDFLKSFSNDERLTFATQESFWNDFLQDDFDIEGFRAFYDSTDNGIIDIEKAMSEGRTMRETLTAQNAEYLNNNHFVGKVYSEEDLQPSWYKNGQILINEVHDASVPSETRVSSTINSVRTQPVENSMTLKEMWKDRFPGVKYHVMDASTISKGVWERNDFPFEKFFEDDVDESVLNWKPMGKDPDMADSSVQSRLDSTLGGKAIVVPPELEEKMKNNPELAQKVMDKVDNFIKNHPTRPGRVLSYLIALDENGDIAHFRVTGGGGHISGPSEAELRQFEEEQEAKREKKAQQEKENREYNLKVAEERKRLQEEVYNRQSAEAILQEQMVSNSKITEIMAAYEAGTFVDGGII